MRLPAITAKDGEIFDIFRMQNSTQFQNILTLGIQYEIIVCINRIGCHYFFWQKF